MEAASVCRKKRPYYGATLLHHEAQLSQGRATRLHLEAPLGPSCKLRCREEEVMERRRGREDGVIKRRRGRSCKENTDPGYLNKDQRRSSHTRTRIRSRHAVQSGFRSAVEIESWAPAVQVAFIRKNRIQTTVQVRRSEVSPALIPSDQTEPGPEETHVDQNKQIISEAWSMSTSGLQRPAGLFSHQPLEIQANRPGDSCREEEGPLDSGIRTQTRSETRPGIKSEIKTDSRTETGTGTRTRRRRRTIQPSAFRGRGQLRLSITAKAGQLIVHIHNARGLMGKSHRSCDSYVKISSDLHNFRMKTQTVPDNKNPEYNRIFTLYVRDILLSRLLVSVFRRQPDSRCSQMIGCMSFGIGTLSESSQVVTGWFYLLGEEYGRNKHLRVPSERSRTMRRATGEEEAGLKEAVLGAELRRTPDPTSDTDKNRINFTSSSQSTGPGSSTGPLNLDNTNVDFTRSRFPLDTTNQNQEIRESRYTQQQVVSIVRGKDGFGFTICSDCPVRVQAVDPGGPAHQSGLRQGDSVLKLNGLPVETWKCVDLAHTIRSCPSQIVLVIWRGLPEISSGCEALLHPLTHNTATRSKLLSHPFHNKQSRGWGQGSGVRSSLGTLGSLWRDRKEDHKEEEEEEELYSSHATTRVTSSNGDNVIGDNYIILSPVNPGGQLLQQVYQDKNGTIGRLYQTHPSRGKNLLHNLQTGSSQQPFSGCTSTLPPPLIKATSSALPANYRDYQNCTMVQSHLPHSGYGTYMTLAPKTLIFPIFVQPLDLCSSDRTLLLSEEMILHQADLLPAKVMVLIYSDLLLLTREDEAGCCHVLQSPLHLNATQIREVPSEPLHIYFLQTSQSCWICAFGLEAFSMEQKVRVSLCLHDNIHLQMFTTGTGYRQQDLDPPSDLHLLSLTHLDLLYRPSSPPHHLCETIKPPNPPSTSYLSSHPPSKGVLSTLSSSSFQSPVWKDRPVGGEEEERQQGEGESASETSESMGGGGGRGLLFKPHSFSEEKTDEEEEELTHRPAALRRSLSEGSLLQEPRSPRFLSDSTIHRLISPTSVPTRRPSPQTLRKQLTREGASLQQLLLLLNGTEDLRNFQKKKKSLAADIWSRLAFLRRQKNASDVCGNSLEKALRNSRPDPAEVLRWAESLEALLTNQYGLTVFRHFLRSEFSEENLDFWLAVETFKRTRPFSQMAASALKIYQEFISTDAARQVNMDWSVRESTNQSLRLGVSPTSFQRAQDQIFSLMETDSYPRFLKSRLYAQLANCNSETANQGGSVSSQS